jgi:D-beta-D-heptose 7-phosphate kinase/D-beta-D-heptose 1-phosphate adenosyltransferase
MSDTLFSALFPAPSSALPSDLSRQRPRIVVVGDVILDGWSFGAVNRLCREGPAPVVDVRSASTHPGAGANTAANLAALGAEVVLVAAVGDDVPGRLLLTELATAGVDVSGVSTVPGRHTIRKQRVMAGEHLLLRVDDGDTGPLADGGAELAERLRWAIDGSAAVVVCDYEFGTLTGHVTEELLARRDDVPLLVIDARHPGRWAAARPDLVTPNATEAWGLLGAVPPADRTRWVAEVDAYRSDLQRESGARAVVVTLDRDGAVVLDGSEPRYRTWAHPVQEQYTAGAGDTFCAALTLGVAVGLPLPAAAELAQAAADVVVHRPGTVVCSTADLTRRLRRQVSPALPAAELTAEVRAHRAAGRRIVFTNGCFDVLHRGHITCLEQAKELGDVLVVALNSDESVRRLKGPERPVNGEADRATVVAALDSVDYVTIFEEDTAVDLLALIQPDIYVKGGDYTPEMLPETPTVHGYGGEVRILDYLSNHSTTKILSRITSRIGSGT